MASRIPRSPGAAILEVLSLTDVLRHPLFFCTPSGYLGGPSVVFPKEEVYVVIALILLALIAIVLFGVGFTIHWLFILAAIAALLWLIAVFTGGLGGRSRGYWY